jgi:hypothetical protein
MMAQGYTSGLRVMPWNLYSGSLGGKIDSDFASPTAGLDRRARLSGWRSNVENSGAGFVAPLVFFTTVLLFVAGMWKTFSKAGKPGWACLVPIYNIVVMMQIAGRPAWWTLLMFIPIVGIVVSFIVMIDIAKAFGKGVGFGLGLAFLGLIFFPILGFGSAEHQMRTTS